MALSYVGELVSMGSHIYVLTYDIEGFVATLTDADMIYWTLIPMSYHLNRMMFI